MKSLYPVRVSLNSETHTTNIKQRWFICICLNISLFFLSFCLSIEPSIHIASSVSLIYNTDWNLHNVCMWYCEKKRNTNRSQTKKELKVKSAARRRKNIAPPIGRTIIQLHAIVYAVIYYDFRTTLWRLSVWNGLIYGLK